MTGDDCFLIRVAVRSVTHLETLLERFMQFGPTTTAIVLSSPVADRLIEGPAETGVAGSGAVSEPFAASG